MLSKCANPACEAKFQYLHSGKVYVVRPHAHRHENSISTRLEFAETTEGEYYVWLCETCSNSMTIQANGRGEVRVVPAPKAS